MEKVERVRGDRYALSALKYKRAGIASEIVELERKLRHLRESMVHVDATLIILNPDTNPERRTGGLCSGDSSSITHGKLPPHSH